MKFNNLIAVLAIISLSLPANAQDGTLRRVAQNDINSETAGESQTKQGVIINNTNTTVQSVPAPAAIPATVVEAAPVVESKAEQLRKARQGAEIATEQKIVEKLEESRLREEQQRADRLFGTKLDADQAKALEDASANMNSGKIAPAPVAPVPAQVTIEKVEIIQPAPVAPVAPPEVKSIVVEKEVIPPAIAAPAAAPAATSTIQAEEAEEEDVQGNKLYVNGSLGGMEYVDASNMKSNGAGGFAVGVIMNERTAVEASFLYSTHYIDTFWNPGIYRELDQYNIGISAKYFLLTDRIKPYLGAGASYISRSYSQRVVTTNAWGQTQTVDGPSEDSTEAVNMDLLAGADFQVNEMFSIGAGVGYSFNVINQNEFDFNQYAVLPENTRALEEIDYWTLKVTGTVTF